MSEARAASRTLPAAEDHAQSKKRKYASGELPMPTQEDVAKLLELWAPDQLVNVCP
jgi:hypothetical protein